MNKGIVLGIVILFIVVGFQPAFANDVSIGIEKQQPLGVTFMKTFGGTESDWGYCVQQTSDGGYIITGYTESFGDGESDVLLIKTDKDGKSRDKATNNVLFWRLLERFPLLQKLIQQQWFGL